MQLKQFYNIATKVSSGKSATTFGDLPDCLMTHVLRTSSMQMSNAMWHNLIYVQNIRRNIEWIWFYIHLDSPE